ncbi:hypothetical protein TcasGA2_TC011853 [Tribolium castaneum]|uniref:Uncharacterized protein n=1 Tax=Tribolium castaneum TaxID=7070 RepID=D6WZE1_TRICA|nr:hypothetical protein TcasGA2_TC011853 [Tribolium castaneum]
MHYKTVFFLTRRNKLNGANPVFAAYWRLFSLLITDVAIGKFNTILVPKGCESRSHHLRSAHNGRIPICAQTSPLAILRLSLAHYRDQSLPSPSQTSSPAGAFRHMLLEQPPPFSAGEAPKLNYSHPRSPSSGRKARRYLGPTLLTFDSIFRHPLPLPTVYLFMHDFRFKQFLDASIYKLSIRSVLCQFARALCDHQSNSYRRQSAAPSRVCTHNISRLSSLLDRLCPHAAHGGPPKPQQEYGTA